MLLSRAPNSRVIRHLLKHPIRLSFLTRHPSLGFRSRAVLKLPFARWPQPRPMASPKSGTQGRPMPRFLPAGPLDRLPVPGRTMPPLRPCPPFRLKKPMPLLKPSLRFMFLPCPLFLLQQPRPPLLTRPTITARPRALKSRLPRPAGLYPLFPPSLRSLHNRLRNLQLPCPPGPPSPLSRPARSRASLRLLTRRLLLTRQLSCRLRIRQVPWPSRPAQPSPLSRLRQKLLLSPLSQHSLPLRLDIPPRLRQFMPPAGRSDLLILLTGRLWPLRSLTGRLRLARLPLITPPLTRLRPHLRPHSSPRLLPKLRPKSLNCRSSLLPQPLQPRQRFLQVQRLLQLQRHPQRLLFLQALPLLRVLRFSRRPDLSRLCSS